MENLFMGFTVLSGVPVLDCINAQVIALAATLRSAVNMERHSLPLENNWKPVGIMMRCDCMSVQIKDF
jgi:hypothetical protein